MRTLGLVVCAQQRTSPRRLCSAARPFSAARALRAHQGGQRARAGVLPPGSSAEYTAQGCGAPRAHGQQTAPAGQRTYGGAARRGTARARVRRAAAAAWAALSPHPAPLQVRARAAGADGAERGASARQGQCTPRERARRRANNGALGKGTHTPVSRARAACGGQRRAGGSAG
jgi:hypothetical protein